MKAKQEVREFFESKFDQIDADRKALLSKCASSIKKQIDAEGATNVVVICTHNSRRSQLGELYIATAAQAYGMDNIKSYSGGSEATAFNHRMVNAVLRKRYSIQLMEAGENPRYKVALHEHQFENEFFSKVYDHPFNPTENFIAILVCHSADEACPTIIGASDRFFIPYVDPKQSDDSSREAEVYDAKVDEIGTEMFYLIKQVLLMLNF